MDEVNAKDVENRSSLSHVSHSVLNRRMSLASVSSAPSSISAIMYVTRDQSTPCQTQITLLNPVKY